MFVVRYFMSLLVLQSSDGVERAGCFTYIVLLVSLDCYVGLPCGAMEFSAVCDCGIS